MGNVDYYTYEADTHCEDCARDRFGAKALFEGTAEDSEGNPVGAAFETDEGPLDEGGNPAPVHCGTCGEEIREGSDEWHAARAWEDCGQTLEYFQTAKQFGSIALIQITGYPKEEHNGYYWIAGMPGCLYDGDPSGRFDSRLEAIQDCINDLIEEDSPDEDIALWYGLDQPEFDPYGEGPEFVYAESSAGRIIVKNLPIEGAAQTRDEEGRPARIIEKESGADWPLQLHNAEGELIATINAKSGQGYYSDSRGDWTVYVPARFPNVYNSDAHPLQAGKTILLDCGFVRAFDAAVLALERAAAPKWAGIVADARSGQ